ncbi:hypothetical protein GSbR_13280 [Geobacter sp. SVR]|nr:hypothetical protein GSVR_42730 [Geobacter sp. SVR]GCF84728.1 hypothetical protein GSbR_13280 [Geobacter sp. SVR]
MLSVCVTFISGHNDNCSDRAAVTEGFQQVNCTDHIRCIGIDGGVVRFPHQGLGGQMHDNLRLYTLNSLLQPLSIPYVITVRGYPVFYGCRLE